jgi:hypothetical protein
MAQQLLMTVAQQGSAPTAAGKDGGSMDAFLVGLVFGIAFGMLVVGFLAVGSYQRGFSQALERRKEWRGELVARQVVARRALEQLRKAS